MDNRAMKKLRILEIGPGTGTLADSILEYYRNYSLDLYRNCEYVLVEISPQLALKCEEVLQRKHKKLYDEGKIKIYNASILDFNKKINQHCFVIGMEILDNMPHDRIYREDMKDPHSPFTK